ncbi:5-methylcytosine-specific restriction endonuclease McrA [Sinorhizobium fredii]|uniref:HNH endonuclease n=1 Tax=Rhizobium fredii TaxID=380 RepID=UPI0035181F6F
MTYRKIPVDTYGPEIDELFNTASTSGREWKSSAHDNAKAALKKALFDAQSGRCVYCRRPIKEEIGHNEIDHILPKLQSGDEDKFTSNDRRNRRSTAGYPTFTFVPRNLALACKRCNQRKGTFDARKYRHIDPNAAYSLDEDYYDWVHPHIHDYSDHIEIIEGFIFHAKDASPNGECVISVCGLDSVAAVERAAADLRIKNAADYAVALLSMLHQLDDYGWAYIVDAVQERFPDIPPEEIASTASIFESGLKRGAATRR